MKRTNKSIVILSPHPDDEWIGCGCTIQKTVDSGNKVKIIYVTERDKSRVKFAKALAKKYVYNIKFLGHNERNISTKRLAKELKFEIDSNDIVYIPSIDDTHPDHQLINIVAREVLKNKMFEFVVYNNSKNIIKKVYHALLQRLTGVNRASFLSGKNISINYKLKNKISNIRKYGEMARSYDVLRKIKKSLNKGPYNIAFLTKDYNTGTVDAGFRSIIELSKELKSKGHNPVIISSTGYVSWYEPPAIKSYELFEGIPIYRPYGLKWFNIKKMYFNPATIFNRFIAPALGVKFVQKKLKIKFDIIHGSSSAPILFVNVFFSKIFNRKAKLVQTIRSESMYKTAYRNFYCKFLNNADLVIVNLNSMVNKLKDGGTLLSKINLINSGVRLESFAKKINDKKLRKKLGIRSDEKVVLYYGKGGPNKGVEYLIKAANFIPKKSKIRLILVHPVLWLPHIKEMVKNLSNKEKVILMVKKINVPEYLSLASVIVLPYRSVKGTEGNPLCLIESMANQVPVVTTKQPEIEEIVEHDKDVLMAKPSDPKSLYSMIDKVLYDSKLAKKLTDNSLKTVLSFSISEISDKHLKQYYIIINR